MTTGITKTSTLSGDLAPKFIAPARMTMENKGIMEQLVDHETLPDHEGTVYYIPKFSTLSATSVTEGVELNNPQLLSTGSTEITPGMVGIEVIITDRAARTLTGGVIARAGELMGSAMARKLDEDLLTLLDGFSQSLVGASASLKPGHISAAHARIIGNATEPGEPPLYAVLHPFQYKAMLDSTIPFSSSAVTNPVPDGPSGTLLKNYFMKSLLGVDIFADGNIDVDSSDDAKGGVFAKNALILVTTSLRLRHESERNVAAQSTEMYIFSDYGYGEFQDSWGVEIYSDASTPTS
jgi:hypothetical protein